MSQVDIAWAAGLFEGEGSVGMSSSQRQPRVQLVSTDEDVVRRFVEIIGRGNVRGYHKTAAHHKDYWQWSVQSKDDVLYVLNLLWPYLGERRRERAIEVIERASKMRDAANHCNRGHDLEDPDNVYVHRKTGKRYCRACRLHRQRERRVAFT